MATRQKVHVKKGDTVMVIAGKDAGRKGKVQQVIRTTGRVIVDGVNKVKRHTRPSAQVMQGGIVEKDAPIDASNVLVWCEKCDAPRRSRRHVRPDGVKTRVCVKCGESFDK